MKRLKDLRRKERFEYITSLNLKNAKREIEDAEIHYIFENNTEDVIREWFEKIGTMSYNGSDMISVYMKNRIGERLKNKGSKNEKTRILRTKNVN